MLRSAAVPGTTRPGPSAAPSDVPARGLWRDACGRAAIRSLQDPADRGRRRAGVWLAATLKLVTPPLAVPLTAVVWASVRVFRDTRGRVAHRARHPDPDAAE